MGWLFSLGIALVTGVVSLFASGFVADWCTRWFEVSEREGGRGYAVIFLALFGFIAGCVLGLVVSRLVAGSSQPGGLRALGISLLAVVGILGVITAFSYLVTEHPPEIDGYGLDLALEMRLPAGAAKPELERLRKWQIALHTANYSSQRTLWLQEKDLAQVEGLWVVRGFVPLHSRREGRRLRLADEGGAETQEIVVPWAGTPSRADERWTEWQSIRPLGVELRYRLQVRTPAPPTPEPVDEAFAALNEQSPLEEWLVHTITTVPGRSAQAIAMVQRRIPDLVRCILDGPPEVSQRALRAVALLSAPSPDLAEPVREIGRRLRRDLGLWLEKSPTEAAAAELEKAISDTFGQWFYAVAQLHQARLLDGVAEFRAVAELAERRPENETMQGLRRVTRHFLGEWEKRATPAGGG
ncbi:MAG: hypothetical protein JSR82_01900 [Verrucomicrobia bacterium]|nr:hypothetical protein [Verrucomicrobiota bacterium]